MAENSRKFMNSDLTRLLQQVIAVYIRSLELRKTEDAICKEGRDILKPWPRQKKKELSGQYGQSIANTDKSPLPEAKAVPPAPEVVMVEKALQKAHKTRTRYKANSPMLLKDESRHSERIPAVKDSSETEESSDIKQISSFPDECTPPVHEVVSHGVISQSKLDNLMSSAGLKATNKISSISEPRTRRDSKQTGISLGAQRERVSRKPVAVTSSKPARPAFASAPYQTQATVKKRKPGQTRAQILRTNAHAGKVSTEVTPGNQGPSITRTASATEQGGRGLGNKQTSLYRKSSDSASSRNVEEYSSVKHQQTLNNSTNSARLKQSARSDPITDNRKSNTASVIHGRADNNDISSESLNSRFNGMSFGRKDENINNNANTTTGEEGEGEDKDLPFLLQRDAKKLSVPTRLSRLLSNNRKMRERLKSTSITKKAQEESCAAENFMSKMNKYFSRDFEEDQYTTILRQQMLCDNYKSFSVIFKDICKNSATYSSHWTDVLKSKRAMEHVLLNFAETEEEFQSLCSGNTVQNTPCDIIDKVKPKTASNSMWLPVEMIPESFVLSSKLKYQKKKQLHDLISLLHRKQLLLLEKYTMEQIEKKVLSELRARVDNQQLDRGTVELYKTAYSFLCCNGSTFPVMVEDSDSENTNEDGEVSGSDD